MTTQSPMLPVQIVPRQLPPAASASAQRSFETQVGRAAAEAASVLGLARGGALEGGLTPEEVMLACRQRLGELDQQIRAVTSEMTTRNRLQSALGTLSRLAGQTHRNGDGDVVLDREAVAAMRQMQAEIEATGSAGQQAWAEISAAIDAADRDGGVTHDEARTIQDAISHASSDTNSGQEMLQIRLQSLMSQRQQAVQLASNLLSILNQTYGRVIDNTR